MHRIILIVVPALLFTGCIQSIAVSTVGSIADEGFSAITEEKDLVFAEKALPGNIKLLEVMLKSDPENKKLLTLISQGYSSYALAYLEDSVQGRARDFYMRGRDYGIRMLRQDADIARALDGTPDDLKAALATKGKDLVPAAFWAAFGWGSYIFLSLDNMDAIGDLPRAEALMQFVARHDSLYYYGGAHVFLGTYFGSRPRILGGNPELSKAHFETALRLNGGKFLMTYVYYARSYAVQTQDEALFTELLAKVDSTSLEVLPEFRLGNAIAKEKARLLLSRQSDLF
jgi:hypothetical protein